MWREIEQLAGDEQMTVLLTTHYLDEADRLADRLAIVDAGRIVVEGTPEELKSELRGDTVHVELDSVADNEAPVAVGVLGSVPGLRDVVADGVRLRARADSGARAVPAVLAALDGAGLGVAAVTVARPSLDDVYLRYAGRTFEEVA
jgi:ABC-2 type transport system ATP-binding protein